MLEAHASILLTDAVNWHHPLAHNLVGWWLTLPGHEGGRYWYDLSQRFKATLTNGPSWTTKAYPGGYGSISLDGSNDHLTTSALGRLNITGDFTFLGWWNASSDSPSFQSIFEYNSGSAQGVQHNIGGTGGAADVQRALHANLVTSTGGDCQYVTPTGIWNANQWNCSGFARRANGVTIYLNGLPQTTSVRSGSSAIGSSALLRTNFPLYFGIRPQSGGIIPFGGMIDNYAIWNRRLSAQEVNEWYNLSRQSFPGVLNRIRLYSPQAFSGFQYTGSGSLTLSGSANTTSTAVYVVQGSGNLTLSGSANASSSAGYTYTGSGSLVLSGAANATSTAVYSATGSGQMTLSGQASATSTAVYSTTGSGSLTLSGSANASSSSGYVYAGSGNLTLSGEANAVATAIYAATGSGDLLLAGSSPATSTAVYAATGEGNLFLTGSAATVATAIFAYQGSGELLLTGEAEVDADTGELCHMALTGSATCRVTRRITGAGQMSLTGSALISTWYARGSGSLSLSGEAVATTPHRAYVGSGSLTLNQSSVLVDVGGVAKLRPAIAGEVEVSQMVAGKISLMPVFSGEGTIY